MMSEEVPLSQEEAVPLDEGPKARRRGGAPPERTCVGTRRTGSPEGMLRLVVVPCSMSPWASVPRDAAGDTVALDVRRRAPVRGAWLTPTVEAVQGALRRGGLSRSFKQALRLPQEAELLAAIERQLQEDVVEGLHMARRAGVARSGEGPVAQSMKEGACRLLLLSEDISEGNRRKYALNAERKEIEITVGLSSVVMGRLFGMPMCMLVSVEAEPFATQLRQKIATWRTFRGGDAVDEAT